MRNNWSRLLYFKSVKVVPDWSIRPKLVTWIGGVWSGYILGFAKSLRHVNCIRDRAPSPPRSEIAFHSWNGGLRYLNRIWHQGIAFGIANHVGGLKSCFMREIVFHVWNCESSSRPENGVRDLKIKSKVSESSPRSENWVCHLKSCSTSEIKFSTPLGHCN